MISRNLRRGHGNYRPGETRLALQNAASIAGMMLTTGALVAEEEEQSTQEMHRQESVVEAVRPVGRRTRN
jgi:hypothetical protein